MVTNAIEYQHIYLSTIKSSYSDMSSESKRPRDKNVEEATTHAPEATTTFNLAQLFDSADENLTKFVNEFSKAQPEYAQAVSNLQQEYIDAAKDSIKTGTSIQKQLINSSRISNAIIPATTAPSIQQLVNQSNDFTNNMVRITEINSQFVINALNATKENLKNNRRLAKATAEYSSNIANAWTSALSSVQNQFTKRQ
jgi:nickel-dependent lactate racemase